MIDRLEQMEQHWNDLQAQFSLPEVMNDHEKYQKIAKNHEIVKIEHPTQAGQGDDAADFLRFRRENCGHGSGSLPWDREVTRKVILAPPGISRRKRGRLLARDQVGLPDAGF